MSTQMKQLAALIQAAAGASRDYHRVDLDRSKEGKITIPEGMEIAEAIEWLEKLGVEEETEVSIHYSIPCYPLDGAYALYRAVEEIWGHVHLEKTPSMFGATPPKMCTVPTSPTDVVQVPWGRLVPHGLSGYLQTGMDTEDGRPTFVLSGSVKRKHEPVVKTVVDRLRHYLRTESIYKGKAVEVDLSYQRDEDRRFDPFKDAPKFMDLSDVDPAGLILGEQAELEIRTELYARLCHTQAFRDQGLNLRLGALFYGTYGTGKTLTARVLAKIATELGVTDTNPAWTFIYLRSALDYPEALRLAELYAPAVVFVEDIDKVAEGKDRNSRVNEVLNAMDGIDNKTKPVISVFTTNHAEVINRGMLRPGRVDVTVPMGVVDAVSAGRFIELYSKDRKGRSTIDHDDFTAEDLLAAGHAVQGTTPAFIKRISDKARAVAMARQDMPEFVKVTLPDLLAAAKAVERHMELMGEEAIDPELRVHRHPGKLGVSPTEQAPDGVSPVTSNNGEDRVARA